MSDQAKHNKTNDEKADMETTTNGALLKELFESIDTTIDNANNAKKGALTLADGKTVTFSASMSRFGSTFTITVTSSNGLNTKSADITLS